MEKDKFQYNSNKSNASTNQISEGTDKTLIAPYVYVCGLGGKKFRTKLLEAFNHWLKISDNNFERVCESIEMLHNASLLIDDIADNSDLRRGSPTAHLVYGSAQTINSANFHYFLSIAQFIDGLNLDLRAKFVSIFLEHILILHRGQGMELEWRDSSRCPTYEEYEHMIDYKTGALFALGIGLMQLFSGGEVERDFSDLIVYFGRYFQIRDDYLNLKSNNCDSKTFCEDITEGKFSFPVIHSLRTHPEDDTIARIIKLKTTDIELKKLVIKKLESFGSFDFTIGVLNELEIKILSIIELMNGNQYLIDIFENLIIRND